MYFIENMRIPTTSAHPAPGSVGKFQKQSSFVAVSVRVVAFLSSKKTKTNRHLVLLEPSAGDWLRNVSLISTHAALAVPDQVELRRLLHLHRDGRKD